MLTHRISLKLSAMLRALRANLDVLMRNRLGFFGACIIVIAILIALIGPTLAPHDPMASLVASNGRMAVLRPPSAEFPFGTTNLGRDILSQVIHGTRTTLAIGVFSGLIAVMIGVNIGLIAGYFGGRTDNILMRITDIAYGMPFLPFILIVTALFGRSIYFVILAITLLSWRTVARVIRAQTISLKQRQYLQFARARGAGHLRIMYRHILPNLLPLVMLYASFNIAWAITTEASASFLGFGDPNALTWGGILQDLWVSGYTRRAWWWFAAPAISIVLLVTSFVFVSRAYEVEFNPRLKR